MCFYPYSMYVKWTIYMTIYFFYTFLSVYLFCHFTFIGAVTVQIQTERGREGYDIEQRSFAGLEPRTRCASEPLGHGSEPVYLLYTVSASVLGTKSKVSVLSKVMP